MRRDKDISLLFVHFCLNYICLFDFFYLTNIYSSRNQNSIVTTIFNGAQFECNTLKCSKRTVIYANILQWL